MTIDNISCMFNNACTYKNVNKYNTVKMRKKEYT